MNSEIIKVIVKEYLPEQTNAAVSTDDGENLFKELNTHLKAGKIVDLDFQGVSLITSAFLNPAIGQLYSAYTGEQLNQLLKFSNVSEEDKALIKKVVERAKKYFSDKPGFESSANSGMDAS